MNDDFRQFSAEAERGTGGNRNGGADAVGHAGGHAHHHNDGDPGFFDRPPNPVRRANAIVIAVLLVFFLAHAILGAFALATGWRGSLEGIVWVGVAIIGVHIVLSAATTFHMFTDTKRPASANKRRHQVLKWITGVVFAAFVCEHMGGQSIDLANPSVASIAITVLLLAGLCWHVYTGTKSFTRDLRLPRSVRTPFRIVVIALSALLALALIFAFAQGAH